MLYKGIDWTAIFIGYEAKDNLLVLFAFSTVEVDGYFIILKKKNLEVPFDSMILIERYKFTQSHLSSD